MNIQIEFLDPYENIRFRSRIALSRYQLYCSGAKLNRNKDKNSLSYFIARK